MATSVGLTVFAVATGGPPVGNGGYRWAIGGDWWATGGPSLGYGVPSMKGPQRLVILVETAEKFLQTQAYMH